MAETELPMNDHYILITKNGVEHKIVLRTEPEIVMQGWRWLRGAADLLGWKPFLSRLDKETILYCINEGSEYEGRIVDTTTTWKILDVDRYKADISN